MASLQFAQYFGVPLLVAAAVSVAVRIALARAPRALQRLPPVPASRLVLAAALTPMSCGAMLFGAAIVGWQAFGEQQLCLHRAQSGHVSLLLSGFTALFALRALVLGVRLTRDAVQVRNYGRAAYASGNESAFRVLPGREPRACVLGLFHPEIYLSEGLLSTFDHEALQPVLAHEQGHVQYRHPLRRLVASAGLLFYLPGTAGLVRQLVTQTQELAADAEAARQIGDRTRVAASLVRFARYSISPTAAFEFAHSDLQMRVHQLLAEEPAPGGPSLASLLCGLLTFTALTLLAAQQLHTFSELILRLP